MMSTMYSNAILIKCSLLIGAILLFLSPALLALRSSDRIVSYGQRAETTEETVETIVYKDSDGIEHEEYAFRAPAKGVPEHVINMFCSSVKVRLYWNVYRAEIKVALRKGALLRHMTRLARHLYDDVRDADKPFNATMLSKPDQWFGLKLKAEDKQLDKLINDQGERDDDDDDDDDDYDIDPDDDDDDDDDERGPPLGGKKIKEGLKNFKSMLTKKMITIKDKINEAKKFMLSKTAKKAMGQVKSSDTIKELEMEGKTITSKKIRLFAGKLLLLIYTRYTTIWWLMMSCLFAKYYLWDPALAEFIKLKRSLLMWPELQLVKMKDLKCKPLMLFRRMMDICKVLNPLMYINFGQFNLDNLTRFKSDSK